MLLLLDGILLLLGSVHIPGTAVYHTPDADIISRRHTRAHAHVSRVRPIVYLPPLSPHDEPSRGQACCRAPVNVSSFVLVWLVFHLSSIGCHLFPFHRSLLDIWEKAHSACLLTPFLHLSIPSHPPLSHFLSPQSQAGCAYILVCRYSPAQKEGGTRNKERHERRHTRPDPPPT